MTSLRPRPGSSLPDLLQWFEGDWPFGERRPIRVETFTEEGTLVVRCELPGMDPERDIHITVEGNQLTISGERKQEERTETSSEFRYGSFSRTITLPTTCDTDAIEAGYDAGILTIRIPKREAAMSKEIPVTHSGQ
jgi:HSP20 family molecular chaperone IbpA